MTSPTQRSLAALRERGMLAEVVERWNPYTKTRKDLFGFVDIVAVLASTGDPFFVPDVRQPAQASVVVTSFSVSTVALSTTPNNWPNWCKSCRRISPCRCSCNVTRRACSCR